MFYFFSEHAFFSFFQPCSCYSASELHFCSPASHASNTLHSEHLFPAFRLQMSAHYHVCEEADSFYFLLFFFFTWLGEVQEGARVRILSVLLWNGTAMLAHNKLHPHSGNKQTQTLLHSSCVCVCVCVQY